MRAMPLAVVAILSALGMPAVAHAADTPTATTLGWAVTTQ